MNSNHSSNKIYKSGRIEEAGKPLTQDSGQLYDPNFTLILVFNAKEQSWKDKTEEITQITKKYYKGMLTGYDILFRNNPKRYSYKKDSVYFVQNPIVIDTYNQVVIADGMVLSGVVKIIKFGPYYKIRFNDNKTQICKNLELRAVTPTFQANIFRYYQELAQFAAKNNPEPDSIESFIYNQYGKIDQIDNESVLYAYIHGNVEKRPFEQELIFPFSFNLSQTMAVKRALTNQISIIEGPPGCGKTQTILNLIANLLIQNKTVAIVSNNNTAIKNISEKLRAENIEFVSALLGNENNKTVFFENRNNRDLDQFMASYTKERPNIPIKNVTKPPTNHPIPFPYTNSNFDSENFSFRQALEMLDYLHEQENEQAKKTIALSKLYKEKEHFIVKFKTQIETNENLILPNRNSKACITLKILLEQSDSFGFFTKMRLRFQYGIRAEMIKHNLEGLMVAINYQFYTLKTAELESEIAQINKILSKNNFNAIKTQYEQESKNVLNKFLYYRYSDQILFKFEKDSYKFNFRQFIQRYPVLLSTSFSLLSSIQKGYLFDYLIVDEASQSDLLSSVLALSCARNLVVVGDSKQLDQIENKAIYEVSEKLAQKYQMDKKYLYKDNSLLGSAKKVFLNAPVTLLREHYRCQPKIINFLNEKYYENKLIVMTKDEGDSPITIVKLVEGNHARKNPHGTGQYNVREIDEIENYLKNSEEKDVGIISPFRIQVENYQQRFKDDKRIEADTVHKFQGRQKDAIIISTVVNNLEKTEINEKFIDFINNPKLFNVAVSRARKFLTLIVTHGLYNSKNNNFSDFIKYAEYNLSKSQLLKGKVTSVFDMLYSNYTEELYHFLKRHQNSKDAITEIIVFDLLRKILRNYPDLKIAMHVPLNEIITNYSGFLEHELKYLKNNLTHVDFVIYNYITKENLLGIEVDGVKYHEQSVNQTVRDTIKNKALEKNQVKLLRIKTNESNEEWRIKRELDSILGT